MPIIAYNLNRQLRGFAKTSKTNHIIIIKSEIEYDNEFTMSIPPPICEEKTGPQKERTPVSDWTLKIVYKC